MAGVVCRVTVGQAVVARNNSALRIFKARRVIQSMAVGVTREEVEPMPTCRLPGSLERIVVGGGEGTLRGDVDKDGRRYRQSADSIWTYVGSIKGQISLVIHTGSTIYSHGTGKANCRVIRILCSHGLQSAALRANVTEGGNHAAAQLMLDREVVVKV